MSADSWLTKAAEIAWERLLSLRPESVGPAARCLLDSPEGKRRREAAIADRGGQQ